MPSIGGRAAAGDPADDVLGRHLTGGPGEIRGLRSFIGEVKFAEALEEVAADLLAEIGADGVARPEQRSRLRTEGLPSIVCSAPRPAAA